MGESQSLKVASSARVQLAVRSERRGGSLQVEGHVLPNNNEGAVAVVLSASSLESGELERLCISTNGPRLAGWLALCL